MTTVCPVCGGPLDVVPGFGRFDFATCPNRACPVISIRIEWRHR